MNATHWRRSKFGDPVTPPPSPREQARVMYELYVVHKHALEQVCPEISALGPWPTRGWDDVSEQNKAALDLTFTTLVCMQELDA